MLEFGQNFIDIDLLITENKLKLVDDSGRTIYKNDKIGNDFIRLLLTKNPRLEGLSAKSKDIYRKIIQLSKLRKLNELQKKILIIDTPELAIDRLETLVGLQMAGNNSKQLKNEIVMLSDYLHKKGYISKDQLIILNE